MNKSIDLLGMRFNHLVVVKCLGPNKFHKTTWLCVCDCGKKSIVTTSNLVNNHTKSCGCFGRKNAILRTKIVNTTHGKTKTKEYRAWVAMRVRCYKNNSHQYHNYGERGIKVCDKWNSSFEQFFNDMGLAPKGTSIDRIDVNGDYEPGNCRWATIKEQNRNKRNTIKIKYKDVEKPMVEWSEILHINPDTLFCRIFRQHWTIESAFNKPIRKRMAK